MDADLPPEATPAAGASAVSPSVPDQPSPLPASNGQQDDAVGPAIQVEALDTACAVEALAAAVAADLPAGTQAISPVDVDRLSLRALFDEAPIPIGVVRADHSVELANPAFAALIADRDLVTLGVLAAVDRVQHSGEGLVETIAVGDRHFKLVYKPLHGTGATVDGVTVFAFDVTEQVLRDAFFAAASHELRDPIHTLRLQLLSVVDRFEREVHVPSLEWVRVRLARANAQVSRLVRLVDTVLDVSRVASGRLPLLLEEVDLADAVRDVVHRLEPDQQAQVVTSLEKIVGPWDRLRLDQVITNLTSNALKYGEGRPIEITVSLQENAARLEVTDHGIGIAPHHQARVFERFERAVSDRRFVGFGLGLWITTRIVEEFGGAMSLRSALGVGSTFTVDLPLTPPAVDRHSG
jgi:signal transduction histidine kinase